MRLLLATMSHETNTFSPVPTKLERFCRDGTTLLKGQAAIDFYRNTGTCMGGYLEVAASVGAAITVPVAASAPPSGRVDAEAYELFCGLITDEVAKEVNKDRPAASAVAAPVPAAAPAADTSPKITLPGAKK